MPGRKKRRHLWQLLIGFVVATIVFIDIPTSSSSSLRRLKTIEPIYIDDLAHLRYAAFGTSRTFGVMLEDRTMQAYPGILSMGKAHNFAIRATGPEYPAWCLDSIVKEDARYDVIVLEYHAFRMALYDNDDDDVGMEHYLARRLRHRFPHALILFVHEWIPALYVHVPTGSRMDRWAARGFDVHNKTHIDTMLHNNEWIYPPKHQQGLVLLNRLAESIGNAHVVSFPHPPNIRDALFSMNHFFTNDMVHFTLDGHMQLAKWIRTTLQKHNNNNMTRNDDDYHDDVKDHCESWFHSGQTTFLHHDDMIMREFSAHKYALEVPPQGGWITLPPLNTSSCRVMVQYMMTGPNALYPRVTMVLGNHVVSVDPHRAGVGYPLHASQIVLVGTRTTNTSTLFIHPHNQAEWPFRITGIVVTPDNANEATTHVQEAQLGRVFGWVPQMETQPALFAKTMKKQEPIIRNPSK